MSNPEERGVKVPSTIIHKMIRVALEAADKSEKETKNEDVYQNHN